MKALRVGRVSKSYPISSPIKSTIVGIDSSKNDGHNQREWNAIAVGENRALGA